MNNSLFCIAVSVIITPVVLLGGCKKTPQPPLNTITPATLDCSDTGLYQELRDPPTLKAKKLTLNTQLSATLTEKCVNGQKVQLQSYIDDNTSVDNRAVGPAYILEVNPKLDNTKLNIQFTNQLGDPNREYDCSHHGKDVSVCTNLHTHGLHVSPKGSDDPGQKQSDYVFLKISPATQTVSYQFDIPNYHAPGTHWIHAHLHGSTSPQVKNGMAGALILTGHIDQTLARDYGIGADKEKIMILQQMSIDENNTPLCGNASNGDAIITSINGQCLPVITVQAGNVQRWRFIHAGIAASINLALEQADGTKQNLHEFARDGITMNGIQTQQNILLQPGYRSDVLLQFPECKGQYPCELFLVDDSTNAASSLMGKAEPRKHIAKVIIEKNTTAAMTLPPSALFTNPYKFICDPTEFNSCSENLAKEKVWFANVPKDPSDPNSGTYKTVNDGVYPDTPTKKLKLNNSNTWKLWVGEKQSSTASHPFHIHVNPFQLIDRNGFSYWKDTLLVSGSDNKGEDNAITVLSRYENFDGKFVLHCHNLDHEDQGMMMDVIIEP